MTVAGGPVHEQVLAGVSALDTTHPGLFVAGYGAVNAYVVGSAGVSSGVVTLEAAHTKDYAGAWVILGSAGTVVADTVVRINGGAGGAWPYVRARVSTVLAGGTVTVVIVAN